MLQKQTNLTKMNYMCICINCRHIIMCNTYSFIKKQHSRISSGRNSYLFYPSSTIITVSVKKYKKVVTLDWDLKECASFTEKPGNWLN